MLITLTIIQITTIILSLAGAFLVANIADAMRGKIDSKVLGAKVFLNESFLMDNWMMIFIACFLFLVIATLDFHEMFGIFIADSSFELIRETSQLGVLACIVMAEYKWFKLVRPAKLDIESTGYFQK